MLKVPPSFSAPENAERRYPLLFVFHGGGWSADEVGDDPRIFLQDRNTPVTLGPRFPLCAGCKLSGGRLNAFSSCCDAEWRRINPALKSSF